VRFAYLRDEPAAASSVSELGRGGVLSPFFKLTQNKPQTILKTEGTQVFCAESFLQE
jgi:hypothetical protein